MMLLLENYSHKAVKIIDDAKKIAEEMGSKIVGSEHLLLALYEASDSICHFLLSERLISKEDIIKEISEIIVLRNKRNDSIYTKELTDIVKYASEIAKKIKSEYVFDEHLFYSLLICNDNIGKNILVKLGVDIDEIVEDIEDIFNFNEEERNHPFPFLTNLSIVNKPHPYISLGNHIERLKIIMNKKQKNNPMLIGSAGVGKTAIVEGLASSLPNETIYRLDLGSMVSGTKYRGELEEKIINAMEYLKEHKAILFIDEIHTIVGAGSNEGSLDAANILKPYLARNDIRCIGATTIDEYYQFIEKDKALLRRFQNIFVDEPSLEETKYILNNIKSSYEDYHQITYTLDDINNIVEKCYRYIPTRTFPDKAIDVLDEVGARCHLQPQTIDKLIDEVIFDMTGLKVVSLDDLKQKKLNYENLRVCYEKFLTDINYKQNIASIKVTKDFVLKDLIEDLKQVFSFKEEEYLEIDLENYFEASSLSGLIGAQKGYVGYDSGGILSEHIIKYPFSLIYFKNLDSAHFVIQSFIKKLFSDAYFVDNKSRKVYLYNTIILYDEKNGVKNSIGLNHLKAVSANNLIKEEQIIVI